MNRITIMTSAKEQDALTISFNFTPKLHKMHTHDIDKEQARREILRKTKLDRRSIKFARTVLGIEGVTWLSIGEFTAHVTLATSADRHEVKEQLKRIFEQFFTSTECIIASSPDEEEEIAPSDDILLKVTPELVRS